MKQKDKGGLGVINLTLQNEALLLKQLDKFYRKKDVQWVKLIWNKYYPEGVPHLRREKGSFWWKDILRLHVNFRGIALCSPNKGDTVSLWEDVNLGTIFSQKYPSLYLFALDRHISIQRAREKENIVELF